MYLKSNVDKFIEAKSQISNTIIKIVYESREYANKLLSNIVANIVAVFAFMITVVLTNVTENVPIYNSILNSDRIKIFELIGIGSIFYAILTKSSVDKGLEELFDTYEFLKIYYTDIFSKVELEQLFDKYKIDDKKNRIDKDKNKYFGIWIILIIIFFL